MVDITDTYTDVNSGSLVVKKTIRGRGAGQQGEVVIQPTCGGTDLAPFTIPAGSRGATKAYPVPVNSVCTVTETVDGHTSAVSVAVEGSGQTVTVPAFGDFSTTAYITDTYNLVPGSLTVTKTIAGPGAGRQGPITIAVSCNENGVDTSEAGLHHPGGGSCGFDVSDLQRHPGRVDLHRHRDRDRRHQRGDDDDHRRQRAIRSRLRRPPPRRGTSLTPTTSCPAS